MIETQSKKKTLIIILGLLISAVVLTFSVATIFASLRTISVSCMSFYIDNGTYYNDAQGGTVSFQNTIGEYNAEYELRVGQTAILSAVPAEEYSFVGFYSSELFTENSLLSTNNPYNFSVTQNQPIIYAKFAKNYAITLQIETLQGTIEQFNKTFYYSERVDIVELITEEYDAEIAQKYINTIATISSGSSATNGLSLQQQLIIIGAGDITLSIEPAPVQLTITQGAGTTLTVVNAEDTEISYSNGDYIKYGTKIIPTVSLNTGYTNAVITQSQPISQILTSGEQISVVSAIQIVSSALLKTYDLTVAPFTNATISFTTNNDELNSIEQSATQQTISGVKHFTNLTITLTPITGYDMSNFTVVMGGVSQTVYITTNGVGTCGVSSVSSTIEIYSIQTIIETYNLTTSTTDSMINISRNEMPITAGTNVLTFGDALTISATGNVGYILDALTVIMNDISQSVMMVNGTGNCSIANVIGTIQITAYASPNPNTPYIVRHYQEKIGNSLPLSKATCVWYQTDKKNGTTGTTVMPQVKNYEGFTAPTAQTITILADGSASIDYFYTRNTYTINLTAGTGISSVGITGENVLGTGPYTAEYGVNFALTTTLSEDYCWINWTNLINETQTNFSIIQNYSAAMPANNLNLTANAELNGPYEITYGYDLLTHKAIIEGFTGDNILEIVFPETVEFGGNTYAITSVAENAFEGLENLKRVVFSDQITTIGSYAFDGCSELSEIVIGSSVTSIGTNAFGGAFTLDITERTVTINNATIAENIIESSALENASQPEKSAYGNLLVNASTIYIRDDISTVSDYISTLVEVDSDKDGYIKYIKYY